MPVSNNNNADGPQQRSDRIQRILHDCIVRRAAGETISDQSLMEAHPDLQPELAETLPVLRLIESALNEADQEAVAARNGLRIRCPHCHNPMEVIEDSDLSEMTCPSCGSGFGLVGDHSTIYSGMLLGHFEILDQLGVGAFGSVWRARDTQLDRLVAIKIPRKSYLESEDTEQFIREARAAAQLTHPNIVRVHEVGREVDTVYLVADFVEGQNLAEWLTDQQATPSEAADLCVTLADALDHAH